MTWASQKTQSGGKDIVWSEPETGIAPSALKGTANLQNVNIATQPGAAAAAFVRTNQAQLAITNGTLTPDGATLFDAPAGLKAGTWITVSASTVSSIGVTTSPTTASVSYLAVGGGGGGGGATSPGTNLDACAGGGGAGELETGTTSLPIGSTTITIGSGGAAGGLTGTKGTNGTNTTIGGSITALGGGGGGGVASGLLDGLAGGSGGGGGGQSTPATAGAAGSGTAGSAGGAGSSGGGAAGGGGGAGAVGAAGSGSSGGNGGDGITNSISGTSVYYAGGGAGGAAGGTNPNEGNGGQGGGATGGSMSGNGVITAPGNATPNTGGGGAGGSSTDSNSQAGTDGGSGIVIIAYPTGSMLATGGDITVVGSNTIHTFTSSGTFTISLIPQTNIYYVSYSVGGKIKLSSTYDPYGASPITHGTTGSVTFSTLTTVNQPIAKATEKYQTATGVEYRYYILDANSYVWVYDTQVYDSTGTTWMLPDPLNYGALTVKGIGILNGWLVYVTVAKLFTKPTVTLGAPISFIVGGNLTNPFPNHPKFVFTGSQGTLLYTDGNFIGEIYPTTSLINSVANIQSYAEYTASTTVGTISVLIGGSTPDALGVRVPVVFFTSVGGTLPTAISNGTVYYIEYDFENNTFGAYSALTGGSALNLATGATGTQYFNTFYPISVGAGTNSVTPTLQLSTQRVNLPFYETAKRLVEVGNTVLIGCLGNIVYPWNQIDAVPSDVITLPEEDVQSMLNVNNTGYIFAGDKGNIYVTNTVTASLSLKIPDYTAGVPGTPNSYIEPTFVWGDSAFVRGRVYCSILDQTSVKAGNCGGVWSFIPSENVDPLQDVGAALRLENQNSYGDYDGYATVLLSEKEQEGKSPKFWAGWQDSYNTATAAFGIDFSTENPVTTFVIETDALTTGTFLEKETFTQVEYKMAAPLRTNEAVDLYYRTDPTAVWTALTDKKTETDQTFSGYYAVNFEKTQWLQFRAIVTTTGNASTSNFAPLKELRLR